MCHRFSPCSRLSVDNTTHAAVPTTNMRRHLATSWATLTQVARPHFSEEGQNPPPANDKHGEDLEWSEEGEENPMEEPVPEPEPKQPPSEPRQPIWPEQHLTYYSFVATREERARHHFRKFVMAANDAAEARATVSVGGVCPLARRIPAAGTLGVERRKGGPWRCSRRGARSPSPGASRLPPDRRIAGAGEAAP